MIRSLAVATAAVLILDSCGSSGTTPAPSTPPKLTGTVFGQAFTPAQGAAVVLGQAVCSFSGTNASATGLVVAFGSFTGLCEFAAATQGCGNKANATVVNLLLVRANAIGATAPAVGAGTYTISTVTPAPDAQGNLVIPAATAVKNDATCTLPSTATTAKSGTIRIDTVTSTQVTGTADVTFEDGSHVAGTFDVPVCGFTTDVCTALAASSCPSPTCVP